MQDEGTAGQLDRRQFMLATVIASALGVGSGVLTQASAQTRKTLRAGITGYSVINSLDPAMGVSIPESMVLWAMFNSLVKFGDDFQIAPDLAESWTTPDPNTWEFKLRQGVKFHDGTDMTAEDVKFSLDRVRNEQQKSPYRDKLESVTEITVLDPSTVRIRTARPFAPLLTYLTNTRTGTQIVSRAAVERMGDKEFSRNPVGTGPFKLAEWIPGQKLTLAAHKDYFVKGQPRVEGVEVSFIPEETSGVNAVLAGNIDLTSSAPFADVAALEKRKDIRVSKMPGLNCRHIELNINKPPFDDVHFRRAVSMAFDRNALVQAVLFGQGQTSHGVVPPALKWAYEATPRPIATFNPAAAKAELQKSKYKQGAEGSVLTFGSTWWKRWAEIFVAQVNDTLGTRLAVEVADQNAARTRIYGNNIQAAVWGYLGFIDPDEYLHGLFHSKGSRNFRGYANAQVDEMLEQARGELDQQKRGELYKKIESVVAEDVPVIFCFNAAVHNLWSPKVEGFVPLPYSAFGSQFAAVSVA